MKIRLRLRSQDCTVINCSCFSYDAEREREREGMNKKRPRNLFPKNYHKFQNALRSPTSQLLYTYFLSYFKSDTIQPVLRDIKYDNRIIPGRERSTQPSSNYINFEIVLSLSLPFLQNESRCNPPTRPHTYTYI